ncbi:hypothetical protein D3C86_2101250 [compost metagenome]
MVEITPHLDLIPADVYGSEAPIGIAVEVGQRIERVGRLLPIGLDGVHAEELSAASNGAIPIHIADKNPVPRANPASSGANSIAIVIKKK